MKYVFRLMILSALFASCDNSAENESRKHLSNNVINKPMSIEEESEIHYLSIYNTYSPNSPIDNIDSLFNGNIRFIEDVMEYDERSPADKKYISNRLLLRQLKTVQCDSAQIEIIDTLNSGEYCRIYVRTGEYDPTKHTFTRKNDDVPMAHFVKILLGFNAHLEMGRKEF